MRDAHGTLSTHDWLVYSLQGTRTLVPTSASASCICYYYIMELKVRSIKIGVVFFCGNGFEFDEQNSRTMFAGKKKKKAIDLNNGEVPENDSEGT